jgi:hypothetical protein
MRMLPAALGKIGRLELGRTLSPSSMSRQLEFRPTQERIVMLGSGRLLKHVSEIVRIRYDSIALAMRWGRRVGLKPDPQGSFWLKPGPA